MTDGFASPADQVEPAPGALSGWFAAFGEGDAAGRRHLLILRFVLLNVVGFALLGAAWAKGWIDLILASDSSRLVSIIAVVFVAGLAECGRRVYQTSVELDRVQQADDATVLAGYVATVRGRDPQSRAIFGSALKLKLASRIAPVRHIANGLVLLGLIGTVVGFIIALSGVDADAVADVNAIGPMVSTLIGGMSVALYTTLVGAVLNIWLMVNYRLLESGTIRLLTAIVERGERHA